MGALVGFASEDTENFLFLLTYTQKNATAFGKKTSNEVVMRANSLRFSPQRDESNAPNAPLDYCW